MTQTNETLTLDPETAVLAQRIAAIQGKPVADVIKDAVEMSAQTAGLRKSPRTDEEKQEMLQRVNEIVERFSKLPVREAGDPHTILEWDEWGLPK
jgi:hypothetical protein